MACLYIATGPFCRYSVIKFGITSFADSGKRIGEHCSSRDNPLAARLTMMHAGTIRFPDLEDARDVETELRCRLRKSLDTIMPYTQPIDLSVLRGSGEWLVHPDGSGEALDDFFNVVVDELACCSRFSCVAAYLAFQRLRDAWFYDGSVHSVPAVAA